MRLRVFIFTVVVLAAILPFAVAGSSRSSAVIAISLLCIGLWLLELTPPFVPTLVLWVLTPVLLSPADDAFSFNKVLGWVADPVLALFFGGFVLGAAAERHGLGGFLMRPILTMTNGSFPFLLGLTMGVTAFLSMWISNIAAAALMFACLRPLFANAEPGSLNRQTLLLGTAFGANLGGIGTPVGTGPNAIAISLVSQKQTITFDSWMAFSVPLMLGMLALVFLVLQWRLWIHASPTQSDDGFAQYESPVPKDSKELKTTFLAVGAAAALWLTEPFHHIPAGVIALAAAAFIFLTGTLTKEDLGRIDWSTLLLIAGGITLGKLLEASGLISQMISAVPFSDHYPAVTLLVLCLASASMSALMSNTATAVLLIPIGLTLLPQPSTAILIAISASFGTAFVISTPPNAMAYGEGGLSSRDFLMPGLLVMLAGCALVSVTGRAVLNLVGIP